MNNLITKRSLSLEAAKSIMHFAVLKTKELGFGGAVAVVDQGGHLVCLERLDGTMIKNLNQLIHLK